MQLDSGQFLLFLVIAWTIWRLVPNRAAAAVLLAASIFFYALSNVTHLALLLLVTGFNYLAVQKLTALKDRPRRALWFSMAVVFDVGLLVFFKVATLSPSSATLPEALRHRFAVASAGAVAFPLGLSFFTFQMISCVTDVYRRKYQWNSGSGSFFLFALFFPQISAGPIPRAGDLLPQLTRLRQVTPADVEAGINLFAYGLFKKLVVANRLQIYVDDFFLHSIDEAPSVIPVLMQPMSRGLFYHLPTSTIPVILAFVFNALRLYADFSGYTDMARGSARVFGINLAENFNLPLLAELVTELWRRWHMTLSNWLRACFKNAPLPILSKLLMLYNISTYL